MAPVVVLGGAFSTVCSFGTGWSGQVGLRDEAMAVGRRQQAEVGGKIPAPSSPDQPCNDAEMSRICIWHHHPQPSVSLPKLGSLGRA